MQQNIQFIGVELGPLNVLQMLGLCIVATLQSIVKMHKGNCKCANANLGCTHPWHCGCGCINNKCSKNVC